MAGRFAGILFQAADNHAFDERVDIAHDRGNAGWGAVLAQPHQLGQRGGFEGFLAGENFIQDEAEGIDIAARRDFRAGKLFGRHVGGSAGAKFFACQVFAKRGKAKIRDAHAAATVEHDVSWLQIAVQNAVFVRGGQAGAHLSRDIEPFALRELPDAAKQGGEIFAVHIFHREEEAAIHLADVEHAANVGMRDFAGQAHLLMEPRARSFVPHHRVRQEFQRDRLRQPQVLRAINLAHSAFAEKRDDAIALGEGRAGDVVALITDARK